ncbi:flagellin [Exiguobacterium sp.]|uniref:flagellin N-terminal helical domain-containing protein n=1 Tax=Exiguobacterium sp. TaxID=44751 RepID=UPI000E8BAA84|nr:flagellin [Exiguobacterium sp.]HBF59360.1 FlaB [Exiguobacterium sp.]
MIINHNVTALNTLNKLTSANSAQSKSMEKLASGLRINKAGDDAAGLAISEKMRAQVRGLDQAGRNAQDGISMIQTAEGALNETHDILQRMRELAVQSGNDTNTDSDRNEIQKEVNQLTSEINRIGNTTEFNTKKLLDGTKTNVDVKVNTVGSAAVAGTGGTAGTAGVYKIDLAGIATGESIDIDGEAIAFDTDADTTATNASTNTNLLAKYNMTVSGSEITFTQKTPSSTPLTADASSAPSITNATVNETTEGVAATPATGGSLAVQGVSEFKLDVSKLKDGQKLSVGTDEYTFKADGTGDFKDLTELKAKIDLDANFTSAVDTATGTVTLTQATGKESATAPVVSLKTDDSFKASLQIGANQNQSVEISINDMRSNALGLTGTGAGFTKDKGVSNGTDSTGTESALDLSTAKSSAEAVTKIQTAIDTVSAERSKLGANQNRLEHTINNLKTSSENLTAAESRVRDVDMAKEMMNQTKNSILAQAAQAMLAQSNQTPQGVLQLLR